MGRLSDGETKRILVIEDNDEIRELLESVFLLEGYHVNTVADGGKALETLREVQADLVTLDLSLPGMKGEDILKSIREDPHVSTTPVIVISAYVERLRAEDRAKAQHVISKPFEIVDVISKVDEVFGHNPIY